MVQGMNRMDEILEELRARLPKVKAELDPPANPAAPWFLDARLGGHALVVEWRPGVGFGISSVADGAPDSYGDGAPDEFVADADDALERIVELLAGGKRTSPPKTIDLRRLRERKLVTQEELADLLAVRQATVSKLERRGGGISVEDLRSVVRALGGELELTVRFSKTSDPIRFETDDREGTPPSRRAARR